MRESPPAPRSGQRQARQGKRNGSFAGSGCAARILACACDEPLRRSGPRPPAHPRRRLACMSRTRLKGAEPYGRIALTAISADKRAAANSPRGRFRAKVASSSAACCRDVPRLPYPCGPVPQRPDCSVAARCNRPVRAKSSAAGSPAAAANRRPPGPKAANAAMSPEMTSFSTRWSIALVVLASAGIEPRSSG